MGQALYRKHRPKNLGEIVGQEHITRTLKQALKTGRISHAYLFTGPRGTGKTSIARILAHEINQLPYTDNSMHLDISDIDAASNRRIDEIRDLRDKVHVAPTSAKYKVYIIDEVHMLTREAFNALLKTLEEPPEHVVFILATTEVHKLPETIISRTQRYTFQPIDQALVIRQLADIAKKEKIDIDEAALAHIAQAGQGSLRDSTSLLDQAGSLPGHVDEAAIRNLLGIVPSAMLEQLVHAVASATSSKQVLGTAAMLYDQGFQAPQVSHQLISFLRQGLVDDSLRLPFDKTLAIIDALLTVPDAHDPERRLEIILLTHAVMLQANAPIAAEQPPATAKAVEAPPKPIAKPEQPKQEEPPKVPEPAQPAVKAQPTPKKSAVKPVAEGPLNDKAWAKVVDAVRTKYYTLYSVLKMAEPVFGGNELELGFDFAFHQKRINDVKNKAIISQLIFDITGQNVSITCVKRAAGSAKTKPIAAQDGAHASITDIFGGGELLKS
jgi:DNA polymerase III subunit gamma/tau